MRKLFRVRCEVNMRAEEIREVIIESNKSGNAIRGAIRQLREPLVEVEVAVHAFPIFTLQLAH